MQNIAEFVDERQKTWCIHCAKTICEVETNRDHVPTKSLLKNPYPCNLPVVTICKDCNLSFSLDEEYFVSFLSSVLVGSTDPSIQFIPAARRILSRNIKLRARIDDSRDEVVISDNCPKNCFRPEVDRISRIILKNARGHAFFEYGEPMLNDPTHVLFTPLEMLTQKQRDSFLTINPQKFWPEVGSRMMTRVISGQDLFKSWVVVQDEVYRYAIVQQGGVLVRTVLYEYLATEVYWEEF